jgi:hypothetical protein
MKIYLQNLVKELKVYSPSLDKQSILVNKPWALIDSELGVQKLIFKKNNELILSKDGQVTEGKWEYLAEAKCLLIDRGTDKILCNETYIDESILVLNIDGKRDNFIVLANENNIPDLDASGYLMQLYEKKYGVLITPLVDDRNLHVKPNEYKSIGIGSSVKLENENSANGEYITKNAKEKYVVENNVIVKVFYLRTYLQKGGSSIIVEQSSENKIDIGCKVTINGLSVENDSFEINEYGINIYVVDSIVVNITYLVPYALTVGGNITIEQKKNNISYMIGDKVIQGESVITDGKYSLQSYGKIEVINGHIVKVGLTVNDRLNIYILICITLFIISFLILFLYIY